MNKFISNEIVKFNLDVDYYEKQVQDKENFYNNNKLKLKEYVLEYCSTDDINKKDEIEKEISRCYNMIFYIKSKIDKEKMYVLDDDISRLPDTYVLYQKPELFELDEELLNSINIENGLSIEQAQELLKCTVNNTRNNLNIDLQTLPRKEDVYDNYSLSGHCGFSQYSSLYPLQKLGLKVTVNNFSKYNIPSHAFGTVTIPINENGNIVDKRYLVDCTYRQFFTTDFNVIGRYMDSTAEPGFFVVQDEEEISFAKELLKNGYIEATQDNLKKYLKPFFATRKKLYELDNFDQEFSEIDVIDLIENKQSEFDYSEDEFKDWGMNLDLNLDSNKKF